MRDFRKICRVCIPFQNALAVKISLDLLTGLWSYGGFKLTVSGYPQIFSAFSSETVHQTPKSFRGGRRCSKSSITMLTSVGLGFHPPQGRSKTLSFLCVCLSVCLFVTLLNVRDCAPDFAMKALEYRNDFDAVGYGTVCSCVPVFNFLRRQLATPLNAEFQKTAKIVFFATKVRQNKPIKTKFGT